MIWMNRFEEYHDLMARRSGQFLIRLVLAICIGSAAFVLRPGSTPIFWLISVLVSQALEHFFLDRPMIARRTTPSPSAAAFIVALSGLNTLVYVSIVFYFWLSGPEGKIFANMMLCGALIHVCLHLYTVRAVQIIGALTPGILLFTLPLLDVLFLGRGSLIAAGVLLFGAALYTAHLGAGILNNHQFTEALRTARSDAERLQRAAENESRSKSQFVSMISHEIRTPLNAVTTAANLLKDTKLTSRQKEYVSILLNGGEVLLGLINQVLDLSKLEAGKLIIEPSNVSVSQIVDTVASLWRPVAEQKGLNLSIAIETDVPPYIYSDGLRLSQILVNLVSNSVKFTNKGQVAIKVRRESSIDTDWIVFEVSDTGPGISESMQDRLFKPFEQADAGTTRRFGGTGLGLTICQSLANLLDGQVTCKSEAGRGSTFSMALPLVMAPAPEAADSRRPDHETLISQGRRLILVAEDHAINRRIIELLLEPFDFDLVMVKDGAEALEAANRQTFDAILMDHQMPILSGLDATRRLRSETGPNFRTPIIAITAAALEEQRSEWMSAGAHAFLTKPIDPESLIKILTSLPARHSSEAKLEVGA